MLKFTQVKKKHSKIKKKHTEEFQIPKNSTRKQSDRFYFPNEGPKACVAPLGSFWDLPLLDPCGPTPLLFLPLLTTYGRESDACGSRSLWAMLSEGADAWHGDSLGTFLDVLVMVTAVPVSP
jgi:hypothetical protein